LTKAYNPFMTKVFFCPWTLRVWPFKNKPNFGHAFTYFWMRGVYRKVKHNFRL